MTYEGSEFSLEDLYQEIKKAAQREKPAGFIAFKDLVDDIIEEKRIYGFFSDDEDLTQIRKDLEARWPEIEKEMVRR